MPLRSPLPSLQRLFATVSLGVLVLFASQGPGLAQYRLGPQDRVRLKIYEWRPSRDTIFEWTALNDEFTVGPDGSLSLPFVGAVKAAGQEPVELSLTIADLLVRAMGLGVAPDVAVEIVEFRPVYITGDVVEPGAFPYRPELTVLQAVSLAGGVRPRSDKDERFVRELIAGRGEVNVLAVDRLSLVARKARLEAELEGAEKIAFPSSVSERQFDDMGTIFMEQETAIFEARRAGLDAQLRALASLRAFLEREVRALQKRLDLLDQQIASLEAEFANVGQLVEQGLAVAPREMALERSLLQIRSDRVTAESALLRAQQDISRTDVSILELRSNRDNEVASLLKEVQAELNQTERRTDTALLLLRESETYAPSTFMGSEAAQLPPRITIVRPTTDGIVEIPAEETSALNPGDTVKVELLSVRGRAGAGRRGAGPRGRRGANYALRRRSSSLDAIIAHRARDRPG